jgi:HD superfamily phosphodiesterase
LFDHSRRVFLFATLKGRYRGIEADPELLYVGAMFHDLGLTEHYRRTDQRFEVDGADLAREFLLDHGRSAAHARAVWLGIALHTTPGVPNHLSDRPGGIIAASTPGSRTIRRCRSCLQQSTVEI